MFFDLTTMTTIKNTQEHTWVIHKMSAPKVKGLFYSAQCDYVALIPVSIRYNPSQSYQYSNVESVDWVVDVPESRK